uniref:Uncharacterized protein n=1 Tax=Aegilops tauschii subsp. strangulata TaxID=200361 RepID=A0A453JRU5_AEGTS
TCELFQFIHGFELLLARLKIPWILLNIFCRSTDYLALIGHKGSTAEFLLPCMTAKINC